MKTHFLMMAEYNRWANERLYRMAAALPDDLYRKDAGAYFKSLHGTLNHILTADRIWMWRLTGTGDHPDTLDAIVCDDLPSLTASRRAEDERITRYVDVLAEPDFEEPVNYRTLNGKPFQQPRREILAHLFNHQTHHRGQVHALLTKMTGDAPSLDLILYQRETGIGL